MQWQVGLHQRGSCPQDIAASSGTCNWVGRAELHGGSRLLTCPPPCSRQTSRVVRKPSNLTGSQLATFPVQVKPITTITGQQRRSDSRQLGVTPPSSHARLHVRAPHAGCRAPQRPAAARTRPAPGAAGRPRAPPRRNQRPTRPPPTGRPPAGGREGGAASGVTGSW